MAYVQRLLRTSHLFKSHFNFFLFFIVHFAKSLLNHWADLDDKFHDKYHRKSFHLPIDDHWIRRSFVSVTTTLLIATTTREKNQISNK